MDLPVDHKNPSSGATVAHYAIGLMVNSMRTSIAQQSIVATPSANHME